MKVLFKQIVLCTIFFILTPVIIFSGVKVIDLFNQARVLGDSFTQTTNIYAALPQKTNLIAQNYQTEMSTPVLIKNYLQKYNSPLIDYADEIIDKSQFYGIKPQLLLAIAQQESNLGKTSPDECYNAWGWGIHKNSTTCFSDWGQAINIVANGLSKNYCQKGLCDDPCEMMKKYTPSSNGSWCRGVNQFLQEMETGNF